MAPRRKSSRGSARLTWTVGILTMLWIWAVVRDSGHTTTEEEALARVIRSEIGQGTKRQKLHVAWAVRNLAREKNTSIVDMVCSPCGPQMRGRPVSSRQRATDVDREIARRVLDASPGRDPTGGATHFLSPNLQNALAKDGKRSGYRDSPYRKVRKRWMQSYGWRPYYRIGNDLELWGPKRSPSAQNAGAPKKRHRRKRTAARTESKTKS